MPYYYWLSLGVLLAVSEFWVPGFVIIFFGAGAFVTGIVKLLYGGLPDAVALLIFIVASVSSLLIFRKTWVGGKSIRDGNTNDADDIDESCVGRKVVVIEAISPDVPGKVELNGVDWKAESDKSLPVGANVVIISRHGLTLQVRGV